MSINQTYKLKTDVTILNKVVELIILYKKIYKINASTKKITELSRLLENEFTLDDFQTILGEEDGMSLLSYLKQKNLILSKYENTYENTPYEKQTVYFEQFTEFPNELQNEIQNKTVAIVGLGGIGGNLVQNLVAVGIKNFILIDFDTVDISNLNRQYIYNYDTIGELKTEACKKYLSEFSSEIKCITVNKQITNAEDINSLLKDYKDKIDLLINAADKPTNIQAILFGFCKKWNIPYNTAGLYLEEGSWGPFITDYNLNISYPISNNDSNKFEGKVITGSFGPINNVIVSLLASDIVRFFTGREAFSKNSIVTIDCENLVIHKKTLVLEDINDSIKI